MLPLVSVVIPCYRQAHFLAEAIASVERQTHSDRELIVVDDGSPDDVPEVVGRFPAVRLIRQENRGLSAARNRGLADARGEFVVFLDADDRLLPHALAAGASAHARRPGCAFVWGFRRLVDEQGRPLRKRVAMSHLGQAHYAQLLRRNIVGSTLTAMFRREPLAATGGFDTGQQFGEDYELFLRLARTGTNWGYGTLIADYRVHGASMSRNTSGMLSGVLRALELQEPFVGRDAELRRALRDGRRIAWRDFDGWARMDEFRQHARAGRWMRAAAAGGVMLWKYPGLFVPAMLRRLRRRGPAALPDEPA